MIAAAYNPETMVDDHAAFFGSLVPAGVVLEAMPLNGFEPAAAEDASLAPVERAFVAHARPSRQREFLAGRLCARRALARFGITDAVILPAGDRRPVWPSGMVGSIAHTREWCAAAVARADSFRGLGIDLEPALGVEERTWTRILTPAERVWIGGQPSEKRGRLVRLIFSAKESAWKCRFPVDGIRFSFRDVEIRLDDRTGTFFSSVRNDRLDDLSGRFRMDQELIATLMVWPSA